MGNPNRGEVQYIFDDGINPRTYTLKFSNAGRVATEDLAKMNRNQILMSLDSGFGDTVRTALFWGATRKFHARDFPNVQMVNNFLDEFDDAVAEAEDGGEALTQELVAALISAYLRQSKDEFKRRMQGEQPEEEPEPEAPKATPLKKTPKQSEPASHTEAGKAS